MNRGKNCFSSFINRIKGELSYLFFVIRRPVGRNPDNSVFENNPAKRKFYFWKRGHVREEEDIW